MFNYSNNLKLKWKYINFSTCYIILEVSQINNYKTHIDSYLLPKFTRWHSPTCTTSIINKARHEFCTKFMEENSKDQGKLFRAVKKLLTAENKPSFYGMKMKCFKFNNFMSLQYKPIYMNTLMVKSKSLNRQGRSSMANWLPVHL